MTHQQATDVSILANHECTFIHISGTIHLPAIAWGMVEPCQSDVQALPCQEGLPPVVNWLVSGRTFVVPVLAAMTSLALIQSVPAQSPTPVITATSGFTLDTPLETIAADPAGTAVLNKDIPGLLNDPSYGIIKSMTLKTIARLSGGDLTDQMLAQTETDLKVLPARKNLNRDLQQIQ